MSVIRNIRITGFDVKKNNNADKMIEYNMQFLEKQNLQSGWEDLKEKNWELELNEYIREGEPDKIKVMHGKQL